MIINYPLELSAFLISQPFGQFVVTSIPARVLLATAFSDRLKAEMQPDGTYKLDGSQRALADSRLRLIGAFIDAPSAGFPNSIILAANYREQDGLMLGDAEGQEDEDDKDEKKKWTFTPGPDGITGTLTIPSSEKLAAIIDGQHRLFGFNYSKNPERLDFPLLCSIYFDLPKPYQAFLFATINSNQRSVSRSQTYELFGYNVEDEPPEKWTPEKVSVFLTRRLNLESDSPFHRHIIVPAENDFTATRSEILRSGGWVVSAATVVEGIVRLISSNPKRDAYEMHGGLDYRGGDRSALSSDLKGRVPPPLRKLYLLNNDELIYTGLKNYFTAIKRLFWDKATPESYIRKTVGVQALFDIARTILRDGATAKDFSASRFENRMQPASVIDFSDSFFQTSGTGRQRIRSTIQLALNWITLNDLKEDHRSVYQRLTNGRRTSGEPAEPSTSNLGTLKDVFATIQLPIGLLNMDYAANNVRNVERVREIISDWGTVKASEEPTHGKQRNEMKLLGFAQGKELTALGSAAANARSLEEIARLWCAWIQQTSADELVAVNSKLLMAKRVFIQFWELREEVRSHFLRYAERPSDKEKPILQIIELLCNASDAVRRFSLNDVHLLVSLLRQPELLSESVSKAVLEYQENKGARGWELPDRRIIPLAWKESSSARRK